MSLKFGQLIQKQDAMMSQADLARPWIDPAVIY
jgi:hypothetical protein